MTRVEAPLQLLANPCECSKWLADHNTIPRPIPRHNAAVLVDAYPHLAARYNRAECIDFVVTERESPPLTNSKHARADSLDDPRAKRPPNPSPTHAVLYSPQPSHKDICAARWRTQPPAQAHTPRAIAILEEPCSTAATRTPGARPMTRLAPPVGIYCSAFARPRARQPDAHSRAGRTARVSRTATSALPTSSPAWQSAVLEHTDPFRPLASLASNRLNLRPIPESQAM